MDPIHIKKYDLAPIFEVRLELGDKDVVYDPIIEENPHTYSVRNYVKSWI